ncbi:MAG: hypothetical protein ACK50Q_12700 [Labrys sp. (in: a-proteobacteria)]
MRIKTIAIAICGAITLTTVGSAWLSLSGSLAVRDTAKEVLTAAHQRLALYDATINLSLERSLTQVGLNLPGAMPAPLRDLLTKQRTRSDAGFTTLMTELEAADTAQKDAFLKEVRTGLEEIQRLRVQSDSGLAVAAADRDPAMVEQIPATLKATVEKLRSLEAKLLPPGAMVPTALLVVEEIQGLAWEVREFGGRERTLFAIATATGAPISAATQAEASGYATRAAEAYQDLLLKKVHPETAEAVRASIDTLGATYFTAYDKTRQSLLAAASTGAYGVTMEAFFAESSTALGAAEELARVAGAAAEDAAEASRTSATNAVLITVAQSVLALAMLAVLGWFLLRSVLPV